LSPAARAFVEKAKRLCIGGEWRAGAAAPYPVVDPSSSERIGEISVASDQDVADAVQAARDALPGWKKTNPSQREDHLRRLSQLLKANAEELAELESLDVGKPVAYATFVDIPLAVEVMGYSAGLATKLTGSTLNPSMNLLPDQKFLAYTRQEPIGVVAAIVPWNFPLLIAIMKIAPAVAAGCTVVVKPPEDASLTVLRLAELAVDAGFPPGVINVVTGAGATGRALVNHPGVDMVAFTGSNRTGAEIAQTMAKTIRPAILELGGKSPVVIMDDAVIESAAETAAAAILFNSGQDCTAGSRLLVQEKVFDQVLDKVVAAMRRIRIGAPLNKDSEMGPLVSERQLHRVLDYISSGKADGAELITGGGRFGDAGYYVEPTLFIKAPLHAKIVREEIFGPVLVAQPFKDLEEAIQLANGTDFGLGASFWSTNPVSIQHAAESIESGTVWVNTHGAMDPSIPFGGYKRSGIGRELGELSVRNYTQMKSIVVRC
jgi:phenylacetaldehyde dehydrogenase